MTEGFPTEDKSKQQPSEKELDVGPTEEVVKGIRDNLAKTSPSPEIRAEAKAVWEQQEKKRQRKMDESYERHREKLKQMNTEEFEGEQERMAALLQKHEKAMQKDISQPSEQNLGDRIAETAQSMNSKGDILHERAPSIGGGSGEREQGPAEDSSTQEKSPVEEEDDAGRLRTQREIVEESLREPPTEKDVGNVEEEQESLETQPEVREGFTAEGGQEQFYAARDGFAEADMRLKGNWDAASPEDIQKRDEYLGLQREQLKKEVEKMEGELENDSSLTPEVRAERIEKFTKEKFFGEFKEVYDAKTERMLQERNESRAGKVGEYVRHAAEWYKNLPLRYKLGVSGLLAAGSIGIGLSGIGIAAGTTYGLAAAGFIGGGRVAQRMLAGGATFISLEGFINKRQQKKFSKEFEQKYHDAFSRSVGEYKKNHAEGFDQFLQESDMLGDMHTELEGGLRERERQQRSRRLVLAAGITGAFQLIAPAMRLAEGFGLEWPDGKEAEVLKGVEAIEEQPGYSGAEEHVLQPYGPGGMPEVATEAGGTLSETEWKSASSVWNLAEKELGARGVFEGLTEPQKTYLIDAIKDKVAEDPQAFGLENADQFDPAKFDYDKFATLFGDKTEMDNILSGMRNLTPEQIESIAKNNETLRNFFNEHPTAPRTSENYEAILKGKGITGAAEPVQPEPPSTSPLETEKLPADAVGPLQGAKTFESLSGNIESVFGDKMPEAEATINHFMQFHPNVSLEKLTAFVNEIGEIDSGTMELLFGEGSDSVENRLALLRNLLIDERLNINEFSVEQINNFEDLIEDEDRFRGIVGERFGENPTETKLRILTNYLFEQHAPQITNENREQILANIVQSELKGQ